MLDVGCGAGNVVLAAAAAKAKMAVGIDINLNNFGENCFEELAREKNIDISNTKLIEGELGVGACRFEDNSFDVITLVDAMEHLPKPTLFISELTRILKPGGEMIIDFGGMFYTPIGHHLWPSFPRDVQPWAHLYKNFYDDVTKAPKMNNWYFTHFLNLNKITADEFFAIVKCCGLTVVRKLVERTAESPELFEEKYREKINMQLVPSYDDLFTERIKVVLTKESEDYELVNAFKKSRWIRLGRKLGFLKGIHIQE